MVTRHEYGKHLSDGPELLRPSCTVGCVHITYYTLMNSPPRLAADVHSHARKDHITSSLQVVLQDRARQ